MIATTTEVDLLTKEMQSALPPEKVKKPTTRPEPNPIKRPKPTYSPEKKKLIVCVYFASDTNFDTPAFGPCHPLKKHTTI